MREDNTVLLLSYLENTLSAEDRKQLEASLTKSTELRQELEALRVLLSNLEQLPQEQPSERLSANFYAFLNAKVAAQKHSATVRKPGASSWLVAAAVALLLIGLSVGGLWRLNKHHQQQIATLQTEMQLTKKLLMLSMLQENTASDRIQALNKVQASVEAKQFSPQDQRLVEALIHTMNFDPNINVRVKAVEALLLFTSSEKVVEAMIESLELQDNPHVQILLIETLTEVKAKQALSIFKDLLKGENIHEVVRQKAAYGLERLL